MPAWMTFHLNCSRHCATWASMGECQKNPDWMLKNCRISCNECENKCSDHNQHCAAWAGRGECGKNPHYMNVYCAKSCQKCTVRLMPFPKKKIIYENIFLSQSASCEDEKDDCPYWANTKGYCKKGQYKAFMELRCKKSCNMCTP